MAKTLIKFLDDLSPSELKLRDLPRKPDGLYNLAFNEYGQEVKRAGYAEYNTDVIGESTTLTGTVKVTKDLVAVVGTGTEFTTELAVGNLIKIVTEVFAISVITDDTNLTLSSAYQGETAEGLTAYRLHKITGMHRFYKQDTSSKEFLVAWDTGIYKLASAAGHAATLIPGSEIHTQANAASDPNSAEANATTGWSDSGTTLTSVVTSPQTGTYCLKAVADDGTDDYISYSFTAVVDAKYYVSIWAKRGEGTKQKIVGWQGVDSSPSEDIAAGDWTEYTYTITASATTIEIRIYAAKTGGAANDEIYIDNVSIYELLTADADTYFADFANHCYIANGEDNLQKYNGIYVRSVGITPPAAAPTGTSPTDTGYLSTGDYKVCYTYVDEDGYESNASASVTIAATADDIITLTMVISSDAKVTKHRIYRTVADGAIFYYDKEIDESTSADLTQADSTLGLKTVLHTDHDAPPDAPSLVAKRRSRLNVAVDDSLYISKNYDKTTGVRSVEYFPSTLYFPTGNGQKITGLLEQLTNLPVFTDDSIERLWGTDEKNFEFKNSYATEGCIATRSLVNCDNLLVYLEFDGIHYFDGVSTGIFSKALNRYIKDNINETYAHLSCGAYFDDKYLLCYPKGSSETPSETIYYDFVTKIYGVYSFNFSCFSKWAKGTDGLRLFGGSNTIGRVYEIFKAAGADILTDDDSAITAYDDIEPLDFGKPEVYKQFYSIFIKIKSTDATTLTMNYTLDDATEVTSQTKTITANTTKWYRISLSSGGNRGRSIALKPYISDEYDFTIMGLAICYDEEPFTEEKE